MTTEKRDYYDILDLDRNSTQEDIKKAFRKHALKYHPDRNKEKDAPEKFKEINEAYQVLSDPEKRSIYDQYGHAGISSNFGKGFEGFGGFGDIFDAFFGGSSSDSRSSKGRDLEFVVSISFEEAAFGTEKELDIKRREKCSVCKGARAEPGTEITSCTSCSGTGQVTRAQRTVFGQFQQITTCATCNGIGRTVVSPCKHCVGKGTESVNRRIIIPIPAGIDNGSRIRMESEGEPGSNGGPIGDLYVLIKVLKHQFFEREHNDVLISLDVNIVTAALGGTVVVPTLDGEYDLEIPQGSQSGRMIRLKSYGVPYLGRRGKRGDQIITLYIMTPTKLNMKQKKILKDFGDELGVEGVNDIDNDIIDRMKGAFKGR
jgi:molecular chaperone DnaJ|tara:strand:+ start:1127 stop:2242 length:1116 start_codon:yes stop_codon:yes gene_type:complete